MRSNPLPRRRMLVAAALALATAIGVTTSHDARAQQKKISFLTWNISDQEELFREWIAEFKKMRPDVDVEWIDKKGRTGLPTTRRR